MWLTFGVRVYTRYKPIRPKWHWHNAWYALGSVAGLVFLGWMLWRVARSYDTTLVQQGRVEPAGKAVPAPAPRTNRPASPVACVVPAPAPTNAPAARSPDPPDASGVRSVENVLEAQVALAAQGISSGSFDGVLGSQTRSALRAYQRRAGLLATGALDASTRQNLKVQTPVLTSYTVSSQDVARLLPVSPTWLGKSRQPRLDYENLLELIAEKTRSHPGLVRRLNPGVDFAALGPGATVTAVAVQQPTVEGQVASVRIALSEKTLQVFDRNGDLLAHFPCSIARLVEKRPAGKLQAVIVVHNPDYTFNPALFPESVEARRLSQKLLLPAGPNNPVGTAWIGLDRPGYGIHGTPHPEQVGRTESHGCFRLANWDAELLARLVTPGTPVYVE